MMSANPEESAASRFVVGIDLGTTNSAVCYVDSEEDPWQIRTFRIPQLVAVGQAEARDTLPSFHYEPAEGEFPASAVRLPFSDEDQRFVLGVLAREQGRAVPGRLIDSAKSWLCHPSVDRSSALLPWHGTADVESVSPVEVSSRYLNHIRQAWDAAHPQERLAHQDIVLTLPASFDEVARELTVEAAKHAGLKRVVLVEEPQAAFYSWIDRHRDDWEQLVQPGQRILICDIGGGTSDFTLIRVRSQNDQVEFHRVAVGEHLILGGDNFDLAMAQHIEAKLPGQTKLEPRQWSVLIRTCRHVKETLLTKNAPETMTINLPSTGARLIGGGLQVEVTRAEIQQLLIDGFMPLVDLNEKPARRQSGFQEFGLPYAADPAITKHLAAFLTAHREEAADRDAKSAGGESTQSEVAHSDSARPDIVMFNGGVFASDQLRERLLNVLQSWFRDEATDWHPQLLENDRLDLAVARGAAYYGMVRRGQGVRIAAGLARTYYVGVEADPPVAMCLIPAGIEPGQEVDLTQHTFELSLFEPVEFPLFISSTRLNDLPGELLPVDREQMRPLPPIRTVLRSRKKQQAPNVAVKLHARLTEIGTLELWCREEAGVRSWQLQFDVRSATQTDIAAHTGPAEQLGILDQDTVDTCREILHNVFDKNATASPGGLPKRIARAIEISRDDWPPSLLRRIWETLLEVEQGRRKSAEHEARWLNLLGFALRPGYGLALDDWRVAQTWQTVQGRIAHAATTCMAESRILWRRIAGGLTDGQQTALASPVLAVIRRKHQQMTTGRGKGGELAANSHEESEVWRMLGSFELLRPAVKAELGGLILDLLPKKKMEAVRPALIWALGRIGSRQPVYGPLNGVVSPDLVAEWLETFLALEFDEPVGHLAIMQMARRTDDRYRDIPQSLRDRVLHWLQKRDVPEHLVELVRERGDLAADEQQQVFGESLPRGLRIL